MTRIWAIIRKEIRHILRDKRTMTMIIVMPLIQLLIYGYAIQSDVKHLATAVFDEDQSPMSRRLIEALVQSQYFDIEERVSSPDTLRQAIDRGRAKVGVHIGPSFAKLALSGRTAPVQVLVDGTDSSPANTAMNVSAAVVAAFLRSEKLVPATIPPIDLRSRMWYNPDLKSAFFMVPGLVGLLLQLLIPMVTANAIVREKERGNIEQLIVTPIRRGELIIGKLVPYLAIGIIIALSILLAAVLLFHVPIRGNPLTLFVMTLLFLTVCLGMGLFASAVAENQQQASTIVMMMAPPSILLSGFIFPREAMPLPIYLIGYGIPLTYFIKIVRGVVLKGWTIIDAWPNALPLLVMAILIMAFSTAKVRKRLR
jgi:ABC-2 type transport system permease protein